MKRRQKELGLYNVLGMEKRHISHLMLVETVFTGIASLAGGLAAGILGSKLALFASSENPSYSRKVWILYFLERNQGLCGILWSDSCTDTF